MNPKIPERLNVSTKERVDVVNVFALMIVVHIVSIVVTISRREERTKGLKENNVGID